MKLDELAKQDNFQSWSLDTMEKALADALVVDKRRGVQSPDLRRDESGVCRHVEVVPVQTAGETVAHLCHTCDEQLPADFVMRNLPWFGEPDKIQWIDSTTGMDCLIVRNHMGALCGYVGVPPEHQWHGKDYGACMSPVCDEEYCYQHSPEGLMQVHGGITFAGPCQPGEPVDGICHRPAEGRPDNVWWFGFDCGHAWDIIPGMGQLGRFEEHGVYRTTDYVSDQCVSLAVQLKAAPDLVEELRLEREAAIASILDSDVRPKVE